MKAPNTHLVGKGIAKIYDSATVFENLKNRDAGKRKVRVNKNTWIYTNKPTDEEAIAAFNKRYGLHGG